jgi:hypothetical protein
MAWHIEQLVLTNTRPRCAASANAAPDGAESAAAAARQASLVAIGFMTPNLLA